MLADKSLVHSPAYYSIFWTFIGLLFVVFIALIIFLILFTTRKKKIKTLSSLKPQAPETIDYSYLREKYLKMVDVIINRYNSRQIKASVAHQNLSLVVRLFYAEAIGFHAEIMTLNDLKRSKAKKLAALIETYYPDEFNLLEKGSVAASADKAKQLIIDKGLEGKEL